MTLEDELLIVKAYKEGNPASKILALLGHKFKTTKTVYDVLKKYGVERGTSSRYVQLVHHYFSEIDTPNKAYVLGLLMADGWVLPERNIVGIQLHERDGYIIQQIKEEWGSDVKILITKPGESVGPTGKTIKKGRHHRIVVYSQKMLEDLRKYSANLPKLERSNMPLVGKYQSDWMRGVLDGDGTIYVHSNGKDTCVRFLGNHYIPPQIALFLHAKLKVKHSITRPKGSVSLVEWTIQDDVAKILKYLYQHVPEAMYMKRKYERATRFLD